MADVQSYGHPDCATCGGRGVSFDREHRPRQCVPCTSERREETQREFGYSLECRGCEAVLTAAEMRAVKGKPKPRLWAVFGPLCRFCMADMTGRKTA
jgi:hypothetical protein